MLPQKVLRVVWVPEHLVEQTLVGGILSFRSHASRIRWFSPVGKLARPLFWERLLRIGTQRVQVPTGQACWQLEPSVARTRGTPDHCKVTHCQSQRSSTRQSRSEATTTRSRLREIRPSGSVEGGGRQLPPSTRSLQRPERGHFGGKSAGLARWVVPVTQQRPEATTRLIHRSGRHARGHWQLICFA